LEKKGHKNHPKKEKRARALPFVLACWRQKKRGGDENEKAGRVSIGLANAYCEHNS
jgi:hypothetical protein